MQYWQGDNKYPLNRLEFGFGNIGGIDEKGTFQVIITDNPDKFKTGIESFDNTRIFISPNKLSKKSLRNLEKYSGLGEFQSMPSEKEILERLDSLD